MTKFWVLRGLAFTAAMLVLRMVQGVLINTTRLDPMLINLTLLALFVAAVALWAYLDGRADAKAMPDPDRRADLAMTWLLAGVVAGALSGGLAWLIALVEPAIYTGGLINELTTFASFTALTVFVPAVAAFTLGRWQIDRSGVHELPRHHGLAAAGEGSTNPDNPDNPDTDVFAAVSADAAAAGAAINADAETTVVAAGAADPTVELPPGDQPR